MSGSSQKAYLWWTKKKPRDVLLGNLAQAQGYEEWEEVAFKLDELFGSDLWYVLCIGHIYMTFLVSLTDWVGLSGAKMQRVNTMTTD